MKPIIKWAGGKRWLVPLLRAIYDGAESDSLVEPFAGGAALHFGAGPKTSVLSDANGELIATYRAVQHAPREVHLRLKKLSIDESTFRLVAASRPRSDVGRAARFLYLNRTAFAGLWRVNRLGHFNVPFGCKPSTRLPSHGFLEEAAQHLASARLLHADFEQALTGVTKEAVYLDPPYTVRHNNNGFIRYNESIFTWSDQQRLAKRCARLAQEGALVVVSNACHRDVLDLYDSDLFVKYAVGRYSSLAARPNHRVRTEEALIVSRSTLTRGTRLSAYNPDFVVRKIEDPRYPRA
jgi:DNA adenine methylase